MYDLKRNRTSEEGNGTLKTLDFIPNMWLFFFELPNQKFKCEMIPYQPTPSFKGLRCKWYCIPGGIRCTRYIISIGTALNSCLHCVGTLLKLLCCSIVIFGLFFNPLLLCNVKDLCHKFEWILNLHVMKFLEAESIMIETINQLIPWSRERRGRVDNAFQAFLSHLALSAITTCSQVKLGLLLLHPFVGPHWPPSLRPLI